MEEGQEGVREAVLEELARLGVQDVRNTSEAGGKKSHYGSKFHVSLHHSSTASAKTAKGKPRGKRSPGRSVTSKSPMKARDERKHTPKSPFSSAKRRAEVRRLNNANKENKVFGQGLSQVPQVCVLLNGGGEQVKVPQLMVDLCNHIRRNITTEGIFRKAGSAHRQNDLKKLLDGGSSLPSSVHVIDCACLLKQYLRCLPEPLLFSEVHARVVASMELESETRVEAMALSILLLPRTHIDTLLYLIDFFSEVVEASDSNKMDARNLAIVLAPNLLPPTLSHPPALRRKSSSFPDSTSEDTMLTKNIEILQLLIENAGTVCRMPSYVVETLEPRHRSQSTEDLIASTVQPLSSSSSRQAQQQPLAPNKKKRRSASIHRLMTGFRRVVGQSRPDPASPADDPASLDAYPGIALSPLTSLGNPTPRKRKSADAHNLGIVEFREQAEPSQVSPPTCKKAKLEGDAATKPSVPSSIPFPYSASSIKRTEGVGRTKTSSEEVLPKSPWTSLHSIMPPSSSRGRRSVDSLYPPTACSPFHPIHSAQSQMAATPSLLVPPSTPLLKRRSFDLPLRSGGVKRTNTCEAGGQATRRRSSSKALNEPDGAESWTPGPRGVPDGAECTLRSQPSTALQALEQQYDDIKSVVRREEEQLEQSAVHHMRAALFPNISTSSQNLSCSEMIQSAYERMKVETEGQLVTPGPSDSLSRRLDRELKIRNRRSGGEHRVIRSPSERRIGTIRRRSKESVQNTAKNLITAEEIGSPAPTPTTFFQTPKMKAALLSTPASTSLRRGRPNSVKSGLPMVVRSSAGSSLSPGIQVDNSTPASNTSRMVVVSRRGEDSSTPQERSLKKNKKKQSLESDRKITGVKASPNHYQRHHSAIGRSPSDAMESDPNRREEDLSSSFLEEVMGPMTRRRSSRLSLTSSLPKLKLSPSPQSGRASPEEDWVCAPEYLKAESGECGEGVVGRPSLAALVKQKKVSSTLQLFNNLQPNSPYTSCSSANRQQQRGRASRLTPRITMTPRDLLKVRVPPSPTPTRIAVVAPLRESRLINIQQEPYKSKTLRGCPSLLPHQDSNNPPKLPPRGAVRPSPVRMQYR
ncbi:hypothetical protein O3P69_018166 [Scylla paramamosain]|uniref:Rho-GAP domain-containing protein n=1 Tax=Scylla paramamosain TaxID=85552 RepID=A0AAW0TJC4_SCYPA